MDTGRQTAESNQNSKAGSLTESEKRRRKLEAKVALAQGLANDTYAKFLQRSGVTVSAV